MPGTGHCASQYRDCSTDIITPHSNSIGATGDLTPCPDDDDFPTAIAFARANGLVLEHLVLPQSYMSMVRRFGKHCLAATSEDGFTDSTSSRPLEIPTPDVPDDVIATIPANRITDYFDAIFGADEYQDASNSELERVFTGSTARCIKLEEIKLGGLADGNEQDMMQYRRYVSKWTTTNLDEHWLPYEQIKQEASSESQSGFCIDHPGTEEEHDDEVGITQATKTICNDKLIMSDMPSDMCVDIVRSFLSFPHDEGDECNVRNEHFPVFTGLHSLYMTPVLEPVSGLAVPEASIDDGTTLDMISSPSSLLSLEAAAGEKIALEVSTEKMEGLPKEPLLVSSSASLLDEIGKENPNLEDLKVEVPLIDSIGRSQEAEVENPMHFVITKDGPIVANSEEKIDEADEISSFFEEELRTIMELSENHVMRKIEQEQIDKTDAVARFEVPVLDFSIPAPGWTRLAGNAKEHFAWLRHNLSDVFDMPSCLMDLDERIMVWNPFKDGHRPMIPNETIESCEKHLKHLDEHFNFASKHIPFAVRKDGLMILEIIDDSDDEIPTPSLAVSEDLAAHESCESFSPFPLQGDDVSLAVQKGKQEFDQDRKIKKQNKGDGDASFLAINDSNSAASLLHCYMQMNAPGIVQPMKSAYVPANGQSMMMAKESTPQKTLPSLATASVKHIPVSLPEYTPLAFPCTFIASLECIKLTREIARLWPDATFIDRDFTRHNDYYKCAKSPLSYEADILVSPTSGIIVTTIQKVLQKPLPGSSALTQLRERVSRVSELYERLIVLVSEDHEPTSFPYVDEGDNTGGSQMYDTVNGVSSSTTMAAYSSFVAFAASLSRANKARVTVTYVAGGRATLARWAMAAMERHTTKLSGALVESESTWEILLRRAGMGLFASLVVLSAVKSTEERLGLAALLRRSPEERREWLEWCLGGTKVLDRVGKFIDRPW